MIPGAWIAPGPGDAHDRAIVERVANRSLEVLVRRDRRDGRVVVREQPEGPGRRGRRNLQPLVPLDRQCLIGGQVDRHLMGAALDVDQLRRRDHVADHDRLEGCLLRSPVARVRHERDLGGRAVALQQVRPASRTAGRRRVQPLLRLVVLVRADRARSAVLAHELRVHDAEGRVRQDRRKRRVRCLRTKNDRVPPARRDGDSVEQEGGVPLEVDEAPEREDSVRGRERSAVREVDVPAQVEPERLRILGRLPRLHELRHRMREVTAAVGEEGVVDAAVDDRRGRLERPLRIGRLDLEGAVDYERRRRCRRCGHGARCGDCGDDECDCCEGGSCSPAGTKTVHGGLRGKGGQRP